MLYNHCLITFRHSLRVGDELYGFTNYLGMEEPEKYFLLGAFHDIGKIQIPFSLLNKEERLTEEEFKEIKLHTYYGKKILEVCKDLPTDFSEIVFYHHENIDGSGYFGLKGTDIPLLSKMIRIIDTYDTMLNGRNYQSSVHQFDVITELIALCDIHFDRKLVEAYTEYLNRKYLLNLHTGT